ncbi:MAG: acetyl-CoA synthetase [Candidatus Methanoliparum thermophilum]|uniref:acetate--CoA ligase (ADP-forming) n=1 Tax=Methanoliparum thermophilum TaxID=2491083 RepID=A0A520KTD3_METT2|nr:acetate--CoA ligase family protein [Candidatus Methanoliparum sp. LAM-1]RZN64825.1 MAG: acetyl-CoA synthetase [Candidatus Methanoliparum thermophilum]BDC36304.1 Acetyl-CoA synthetase II (AMP-forming) subunit B [Candidatus Methanoliparum sp. LAM-1]
MSKEDTIKIIKKVREEGRKVLTEYESKKILSVYGIPITREKLAKDLDESIKFAEEIGYPVVLKIVSPDITHKTDLGGVKIGIKSQKELEEAYTDLMRIKDRVKDANIHGVLVQEMLRKGNEVILGMTQDPQFGPVIMFGLGGVFVEVLKDVSFKIPPLTRRDAEDMIKEIKAYPILEGARGGVVSDMNALIDCILKLSELSLDLEEELKEMDINPLFAMEKGAAAVDSLILLR